MFPIYMKNLYVSFFIQFYQKYSGQVLVCPLQNEKKYNKKKKTKTALPIFQGFLHRVFELSSLPLVWHL